MVAQATTGADKSALGPVDAIDSRCRQPQLHRNLLTDPWRPLLAGQEDLTRLHVWRLKKPALLAIDRVGAEQARSRENRWRRRSPMPQGLGRRRRLHADAMGCSAGNHHDPAVSRADALPISGPFAALDLMHIQYRRCGAARGLVA